MWAGHHHTLPGCIKEISPIAAYSHTVFETDSCKEWHQRNLFSLNFYSIDFVIKTQYLHIHRLEDITKKDVAINLFCMKYKWFQNNLSGWGGEFRSCKKMKPVLFWDQIKKISSIPH